jgi:hypothetical protein
VGRLLLIPVLLAGALSGCNNLSSSTTFTVLSASTAPPTTQPPALGSQAELSAYLARVEQVRKQGDATIDKANRVLNHIDSTPDSTWNAAGRQLHRFATRVKHASDRISAIVAPHQLMGAHLAYARRWREDSLVMAAIAVQLHQHTSLVGNNSLANASQRTVSRYRVALIAYAARHHLHLPRWVHHIGG